MKKYITIILIIVSFTGLLAKHSDNFLIGDYSRVDDNINNTNYYINAIKEAGFNTVRLKTKSWHPVPYSLDRERINQLDADGIDIVIWDNGYDVDGNTHKTCYTPYMQSISNKMEFLTNYTVRDTDSPTELSGEPDWFYGFKYDPELLNSSTIEVLEEDEEEKGILCKPLSDSVSYTVFKDLYIRENMYLSTSIDSYDDQLLYPFNFTFYQGVVGDSTLYLYITFKMRINRIIENDYPICKLGLKVAVNNIGNINHEIGWDYNLSELLEPVNPEIQGYDEEIEGFELYQDDFPEDETSDYKEFTYKLKLDRDYINNYLSNCDPAPVDYDGSLIENPELSVINHRIVYMSPTLEFYCNRDTRLYVKSVEFKDQVIKNWEEPEYAVNDSIAARIDEFYESNIIGFDIYDEPVPAQFEAVKKLNNLLTSGDLSRSDYTFHTAITNYGRDFNNLGQTYSLLEHFKSYTGNKILSPDPYLYGNNTARYNNSSVSDSSHIQYITDKISQSYKKARLIATDGYKFIPIVQAFGDWNNGSETKWERIMIPPTAQQKMLMYLPLCYDPDGIKLRVLDGFDESN